MKYLLCLLFLTGCQMNPENIKLGDKVMVKSGFYENCVGYVSDFEGVVGYLTFKIEGVVCPKASMTYLKQPADNIEKL